MLFTNKQLKAKVEELTGEVSAKETTIQELTAENNDLSEKMVTSETARIAAEDKVNPEKIAAIEKELTDTKAELAISVEKQSGFDEKVAAAAAIKVASITHDPITEPNTEEGTQDNTEQIKALNDKLAKCENSTERFKITDKIMKLQESK